MKKNFRSIVFVIFHLFFWVIVIYLFFNFSHARPLCIEAAYKEFIAVGFMAAMAYLNYFILIPQLFSRKHYVYYILISLFAILFFTLGEYYLVRPNVLKVISNLPENVRGKFLFGIFQYMLFRYAGIFLLFTLLKLYNQALRNIEMGKQLAAEKEERNKMEKEYLESRISPTYLLNVISSLRANAIEQDEKMPENMGKLAQLLDYFINYSKNEKVLLSDEIQFYQNYLELEFLKREEFLALSFIVQDIPFHIELPPLLFEPIIFNACRWVSNDADAHIKFELSIEEPHTLRFESKSSITPSTSDEHYVDNEMFEKLGRRLQALFPGKHTLKKNVTEEYIEVLLTLVIEE